MSEKVKGCQMQQYRRNVWQVCELSREDSVQMLKNPTFILSQNNAIVWTVTNLRITAISPAKVFSACMEQMVFIGISSLDGARETRKFPSLSPCVLPCLCWFWNGLGCTWSAQCWFSPVPKQLILCSDAEGNQPCFCTPGPCLIRQLYFSQFQSLFVQNSIS